MMKLIRYSFNNREHLLLYLGNHAGKVYGLDSMALTQAEKTAVKQAWHYLSAVSLNKRLEWLKQHMPRTYSAALRTPHEYQLKEHKTYQV
jgi:hypothetical protein